MEGKGADEGREEATDNEEVGGQAIKMPEIARLRQKRLRRMRRDTLSAISGLAEM